MKNRPKLKQKELLTNWQISANTKVYYTNYTIVYQSKKKDSCTS